MIKNSNIDSDICVPNLNATHLKPLNLKGLTIAHLIDQFRLYLHKQQQFDVICVNKTRLDIFINISQALFCTYQSNSPQHLCHIHFP
jgi:hypothetical protein